MGGVVEVGVGGGGREVVGVSSKQSEEVDRGME